MRAVLLGLLLVLSFNVGHAQDANPTSQRQNLLKAIKQFKTQNAKDASTAIEVISGMKYAEIPELLIEMANYELDHRKNKRVMLTLLDAIKRTADIRQIAPEGVLDQEHQVTPLVDLRDKIEALKPQMDPKQSQAMLSKEDIRRLLLLSDKVKDEVRGRKLIDLPKLFPTFENVTMDALESRAAEISQMRDDAMTAVEPQVQSEEEHLSSEPVTTTLEDQESAKTYQKFQDQLKKLSPSAKSGTAHEVKAGDSGPADLLLAGTTRFITDEIQDDILNDNLFQIIGRDDILENVLLILSRYKQQNAVLLGSKGSGKTSIVDLIAEKIVTGKVANNEVTSFLKDAVVIQTSSARISRLAKTDKPAGQADAMEAYFQALSDMQKRLGRRIIVFIDEIHTLTPEQVESIKPFIESPKSQIMLIGASTSPEYRGAFKYNEAFLSRMQDEPIRELSEKEILYIFQNSWIKILSARHPNVSLDESVMKLIIRKSQLVFPDKGALRASFHFTDDLMGYIRYKNSGKTGLIVSPQDVYGFITKKIGLPVDPTNYVEMKKYSDQLKADISKDVFDQPRMIGDVVDLWMSVLRNESPRGIRVGMLMGKTGTGKTETATQLAIHALGSKERVLVIKASDYADANDIKLSVLFGVPSGVKAGTHSAGVLMDWLDDPSKGKYAGIIVIDEAEKANALFWIRFMEFFDTGAVEGGDHKTRMANRHLVLLTSNRGDAKIFPKNLMEIAEKNLDDRLKEFGEEELKSLFEEEIDGKKLPDTITNRIDMYTVSNLILPKTAKKIGKHLVRKIAENYLDRSSIEVQVDENFIESFIRATNPLERGARPMVRALHRYLENAIQDTLGSIPFQRGDKMFLKVVNADGDAKIQVTMNSKVILVNMPRFKIGDNETVESYLNSLDQVNDSLVGICSGLFDR